MQDFVIATETVGTGKYTLEVRGLSFQDFTTLFMRYGKSVDQIFKFIERAQSGEQIEFSAKEFGTELIVIAPKAVASLIALAADLPDKEDMLARTPLPFQIQCLEKIYKLTVEEAGGLNDFLALVLRIAKSVSQNATAWNNSQQKTLDLVTTGS